ncbi:MAG: SNF2-related protein [Bacillota bacterium]
MVEPRQGIVYDVPPPELLERGRLNLEGEFRNLLRPYSGRVIVFYNEYGDYALCKVHAGAGYLTSPRLKKFFAATKITKSFCVIEDDAGVFLVKACRKSATTGRVEQIEQLSLFSGEEVKTAEKAKTTVKEERQSGGAAPGSRKTARRSVGAVSSPDGSRKKRSGHPGKASLDKTKTEQKETVRKTPSAPPLPSQDKTKTDPKGVVLKTPAVPPSPSAGKTKTGQRQKEVILKSPVTPPLPSTPVVETPVKVTFYPDEDTSVLTLAAGIDKKRITSIDDLFLHRQALLLSLSPGFDRLLSLNASQNVQPLDYQLATVRHVLKSLRGRALLCDEVGLGKTIEACLVMLEYMLRGLVRRVLILVPPSLVEQWQQELRSKFSLDFIAYDSPRFKGEKNPWAKYDRIIASLDTAKREPHRKRVMESSYDLVIVDEAHHLKNHLTQAYQLVSLLKKKYILLLTATPVENNLEELFNLITLLQPGQLETVSSFKRKYITRGDPLKPKNTEALRRLVQEVMVRNRRSQTGVITSRRRAEVIEVELSPDEMAFYRRLSAFVREHYFAGEEEKNRSMLHFILKTLQREVGSSIEAVIPTLEKMAANPDYPVHQRRLFDALAGQARAVAGRKKAEALLRLIAGIPDKTIVFTGFTHTHSFLVEWLRVHGLSVAELHGGMRRQQKEEELRLFAGDAKVLISTETGSEGRNLQFCRYMINYDLPWNPMRIEQRIGRIHRLGQTKDVYIYNLSAAKTIEAYILELLDAKINMFQLVVGELDMIIGNLKEKQSFEDIVMDIWSKAASEEELEAGMEEFGQKLMAAKEHYLAVKDIDDKLLGELGPQDE